MQIELLSNKIYVSCRELFYVLIGEPLKYDPDFKGPIHGKQRYVGIEWHQLASCSVKAIVI